MTVIPTTSNTKEAKRPTKFGSQIPDYKRRLIEVGKEVGCLPKFGSTISKKPRRLTEEEDEQRKKISFNGT